MVSYLILNIVISWVGYGAGVYSNRLFAEFQMDMGEKLVDADLEKLESNAFREQSEKAKKIYMRMDGGLAIYLPVPCKSYSTQ